MGSCMLAGFSANLEIKDNLEKEFQFSSHGKIRVLIKILKIRENQGIREKSEETQGIVLLEMLGTRVYV